MPDARGACRGAEAVPTADDMSRQHRLNELGLLTGLVHAVDEEQHAPLRQRLCQEARAERRGGRCGGSLRDGGFEELESAGGHVVAATCIGGPAHEIDDSDEDGHEVAGRLHCLEAKRRSSVVLPLAAGPSTSAHGWPA